MVDIDLVARALARVGASPEHYLDGNPEQRRLLRIVDRLGAGATVGLAAQRGAVPVLGERPRWRARPLAQHLNQKAAGGEAGAAEGLRDLLGR